MAKLLCKDAKTREVHYRSFKCLCLLYAPLPIRMSGIVKPREIISSICLSELQFLKTHCLLCITLRVLQTMWFSVLIFSRFHYLFNLFLYLFNYNLNLQPAFERDNEKCKTQSILCHSVEVQINFNRYRYYIL